MKTEIIGNFMVCEEGECFLFIPIKPLPVKTRSGQVGILTQTMCKTNKKFDSTLFVSSKDNCSRYIMSDGPFYNGDRTISQHDLIDPSEYEPYFNEIQEILRKKNKVKLDMTVAELSRILSTYEGDAITEDDLVQHFGRNGFQFKG